MTASQSSSSIWMARLSARTPALLTSASTGPSCSVAVANSASGGPSATSPPIAAARPPASSMACTVACAPASSERKLTATSQPSAASALAMAAPMPLEAPVTSAVAPSGRLMPLTDAPLDDAGAPREAGADGAEQDPLAGPQAAVLAEERQGERDGGGGRVPGLADVV